MKILKFPYNSLILPEIKKASFYSSKSYIYLSRHLSKIAYSLLFLHIFSVMIISLTGIPGVFSFAATLPGLIAVPLTSWHVVRKLDRYTDKIFLNAIVRSLANLILGLIFIAWIPSLIHALGGFSLEIITRILELMTIIISICVMSGLILIALGTADFIYTVTNHFRRFSHRLIVLLIVTGLGTFFWLSFVGLQIHTITEWAVERGHLEAYVSGLELLSRSAGFYVSGIAGAMSLELPFLALLAWRFGNRASSGISQLHDGFQRALQGDYKTPVPVYGSDEISVMQNGFNLLLKSADESRFLENAFGQYVSPLVLDSLREKGSKGLFQGEKKEATVVFTDICGFTAMSSYMSPEDVISVLNSYMSLMIDIIQKHDGYINKFVGDGIMILFNVPVDQKNHAVKAMNCSMEMLKKLKKVNEQGLFKKVGSIRISIGINTGTLVMGNLGNESQTEFTVIGDTVNVASRACSFASDNEIALTKSVLDELKKKNKTFRPRSTKATIKGKGTMTLYTLKYNEKLKF